MSQQSLNSLAPDFVNKYDRPFMDKAEMSHHFDGKMSKEDYHRWCKRRAAEMDCEKRMEDCNVEPCVEPCETSCFGMGWLGVLILWFIIFTVLFWLIFYSIKPSWATNPDGSVNTSKILLAALLSALVLIIIIWLIKACIDYSC
ncbi:MAG TPA: hypothetical protein VLG50_02190 [Candidatus Saccharimonadales bacterium]|nr:hypothetical protein [Candidatus Saccharimonadales bacterium]